MKRKLITALAAVLVGAALLAGCTSSSAGGSSTEETAPVSAAEESTSASEPTEEAVTDDGIAENTASASEPAEEAAADDGIAENTASASDTGSQEAPLEDGVYLADFDSHHSMFHVNEANDGKGILTVQDGQMTIHVSLVSKKIVNLYPGLAEDAKKEGAELLEPTLDTITYSDGWTEEVYGFDIPVPVLDEEFDCALIGTKGKWYNHRVIVSNPEPYENAEE